MKGYIIVFLIGALFTPAARELLKRRGRDGWDRLHRQRVRAMRGLYGYDS
jgi:hypothetical protein